MHGLRHSADVLYPVMVSIATLDFFYLDFSYPAKLTLEYTHAMTSPTASTWLLPSV